MDDATQKLGTCLTCRHAEHEGYTCLNMASDNDCGCDKRPPKVDDATQKLDGADTAPALIRQALDALANDWNYSYGGDFAFAAAERLEGVLTRALEAAQRPPVSGDDTDLQARLDEAEEKLASLETGCMKLTREELIQRITAVGPARWKAGHWLSVQRAKWEAERPPVIPEVREEVIDALRAVTWPDGEPLFKIARVHMGRAADALLDRFSIPSQPVYDEEKIARWLYEEFSFAGDVVSPKGLAAALVTALRGGELNREEGK